MSEGEGSPPSAVDAEISELAKLRHDLRTPLNQILGYSELILETVEDEDLSDLEGPLKLINKAGNTLLATLNEEMAPHRIAAGRFHLGDLQEDLAGPLDSIGSYHASCRDRAAGLGRDDIVADLHKIMSAVSNLRVTLAKAIMPTPSPAAATSAPAAASVTRSAPPPAPAERLDGTLLLVDDDMINREMMSRRLEHMGFDVATAESGEQALEWLEETAPDLILLDILMPGMNGFETLERIKAKPAWAMIPVIMLTALDDAESTGRCIAAGAEDYAAKPFNATVLRARISSALEKKRLRENEQRYLARIRELEAQLGG
ncbi:response regulator [Actomonas aquatica]|uniref:histidine kinase n=1 Tax=Actomonas aquatica TaxID=2866162 RepID=A0ABZ1C9D1_9BACT|nr:response regulator [Opitutus sp. WL0086]WRQ86925.1 response regulator [Opitutus sp. WL0086]